MIDKSVGLATFPPGMVIDNVDCSGMTCDPKKDGIPPYLQTQNRRPLTAAQQANVDAFMARAVPVRDERDEGLKAFIAEENERRRVATQNRIAKMLARKAAKSDIAAGARWDTRTSKWIHDTVVLERDQEKTMAKPAVKTDDTSDTKTITKTKDKTEVTGQAAAIPALDTTGAEKLVSTFDPEIFCHRIPNSRKVVFRGQEMTLSRAALTVANEKGKKWTNIQGPMYWMLNGVKLAEIGGKKKDTKK